MESKLTDLHNRIKDLEKDSKETQQRMEKGFSLMLTLISVLLYLAGKTPLTVKKLIVSDKLRDYRAKLIQEFNTIEHVS